MAALDYSVFGLSVRSGFALPELPRAEAQAEPDVIIGYGGIDVPSAGAGYSATEAGTLLTVPEVGRYLIREGREVVIEAAPGASERNLRLFLLGSAFGALLHQRGLLPLHANVIDMGGRAVAFSGHSGAGKSTIAAWFHDRGHRVLGDDVCVVGFDAAGRALAHPGIPRLRLWRDALDASSRAPEGYERSFDQLDKYDVPTAGGPQPLEAIELAAIYLLRRADEGSKGAEIRRLTGVAAVETLVENTYRGAYLKTIGRTRPHLATCVQLARAVPVFLAERRWGFDCFDDEAERLREHAHGRVEGAGDSAAMESSSPRR